MFNSKKNKSNQKIIILFLSFLSCCLTSCEVGPNYVRPSVPVPAHYKEASKHWKVAKPQDTVNRGAWWQVFHNAELDSLERRVNVCNNQNIAAAEAAYRQALAMVDQARAGFFPTLAASASAVRQKQAIASGSTVAVTNATNTTYNVGLNASWEPDLWGGVRRLVEANVATAQATAAVLANTTLSMQATLAQDYFQLRTLDADQDLLNKIVQADKATLQLTKDRYKHGVASLSDVAQAETQLKNDESAALENGINRAVFEHAIAVLIGVPPANFSLKPKIISLQPPTVPVQLPSTLLERRPDIAQAERQVASANANIGVAISAFFPTVPLTTTAGSTALQFGNLFTSPATYWSVGVQITQTILDGGMRMAQVAAARAGYQQTVAQYRQVVLAAYQEVEDTLATLRILAQEIVTRHQASISAQKALALILANYKSGTAAYTDVIVAQNVAYNALKNETDLKGRRMVATVTLIKALGGPWDYVSIITDNPPK